MKGYGCVMGAVCLLLVSQSISGDNDIFDKDDTNTTAHPSTTASVATTSTENPTSTKTNPSTTSPVATTTSLPITTTTLPPEPPSGHWKVNESNTVCIIVEAGIRMSFNYKTKDGKMNSYYRLDVPKTGVFANGTCGNRSDEQSISLFFFDDFTLTLKFVNNQTVQKYELSTVELEYKMEAKGGRFPNVTATYNQTKVNKKISMFATDDKKKYVCVANQILFKDDNNKTEGLVELQTYSLQFQAFSTSHEDKFTNGVNRCKDDEVSQLVPIIVGAALGGLIVIVLIAYLIGRRRSRRGYESV